VVGWAQMHHETKKKKKRKKRKKRRRTEEEVIKQQSIGCCEILLETKEWRIFLTNLLLVETTYQKYNL
jgi:hypothetical protein